MRAVVKGFDQYIKQVGKMQTSTQKFGNLLKTGVKVGAVAAAAGIGFAIKGFADFDAAMTKSLAIMGDVSDELRVEMTKAAREMALKTTFSAKDAAESYFFLASAGLDAGASIEALPVVASFAQAGMFDMALATDLLTDSQSALGLTIKNDAVKNMENMVRVSDVLVKANTIANATVQQFAESLTTEAAAAMRQFNIDMEEGVAVLAVFADQGLKGQAAGTALSRVLLLMTSAAVENADAYEELGVRVFDASGNIRNMADIIADLEVAFDGMSDAQRVAALDALGFQARVQGVINKLIGSSEAIREYEAGLRDAGDITQEVATKQLDTFNAQMNLLTSAITDVAIELGSILVPILREFVEHLRTDVVPLLKEWIKLHEEDIEQAIRKTISVIGDLVKALKPFFENFIGGLQTLLPLIQGVFGFIINNQVVLIAAILAIGVAMATAWGPASAAVIGAAALITLMGAMKREVGPLTTEVVKLNRAVAQYEFVQRTANRGTKIHTSSLQDFAAGTEKVSLAQKSTIELLQEATQAYEEQTPAVDALGRVIEKKYTGATREAIDETDNLLISLAKTTRTMEETAEETEGLGGAWEGAGDAAGGAAEEVDELAESVVALAEELIALHAATGLQTALNQEAVIAGHEFAVILREVEGAALDQRNVLELQIDVLEDQLAVMEDASGGNDILAEAIRGTIEAIEDEITALDDSKEQLLIFGEDGVGPITAQLRDLKDIVDETSSAFNEFLSIQTQGEADLEATIALLDAEIEKVDELVGQVVGLTGVEQERLDILTKRIPVLEAELEVIGETIDILSEKKKEEGELSKAEKKALEAAKERRNELRESIKTIKKSIDRLEEKSKAETAAGKAAGEHTEALEKERDAAKDDLEEIEANKEAIVKGLEARVEGRPTLDRWTEGIVEQAEQTGVLTGVLDDVPPALREWINTHGDFVFEVGRGMNRLLLAQRDFVDDSQTLAADWADVWTQAAQDIIDGMEEVLDVGSPSKEMMRIGQAMREGLELGLSGGASIPTLAGGGVARDAIVPAALPPAPVPTPPGGGDFNANISVASEGDIAEEVGREMRSLAFSLKRP